MAVKESIGAPAVTIPPAATAARRRFDWPAYAVLAAISAVGAGFAAWAYPIWEDGLWHMFYHLGSDRPAEYVGTDRPLFCWLVKWIYSVPQGVFWFETIGLSVLTTLGLGLFTLYLAKRVLPRGQALATACLATVPLLESCSDLVDYLSTLARQHRGRFHYDLPVRDRFAQRSHPRREVLAVGGRDGDFCDRRPADGIHRGRGGGRDGVDSLGNLARGREHGVATGS